MNQTEQAAALLLALAIYLQARRAPAPLVRAPELGTADQAGDFPDLGTLATFRIPDLSGERVDQLFAVAYAPAPSGAVWPHQVVRVSAPEVVTAPPDVTTWAPPSWRADPRGDHRQATPWDDVFASAARHTGVPLDLLKRVAWQESRFDPRAISSAGAVGLMQIVPRWHPGVDDDPRASYAHADETEAALNPAEAIPYAARYLAQLRARFGSWRLALAAYNWGQGHVAAALEAGRGEATWPAETRQYLARIADAGGYA